MQANAIRRVTICSAHTYDAEQIYKLPVKQLTTDEPL